MISLLGYNFFGDGNALDPVPTNVQGITNTFVSGGIIDNFTLTGDINDSSSVIPSSWIAGMIINSDFNGNINGGTLEETAKDVTGYKIKRRKLGEFDWITLYQKQISNFSELSFAVNDHLNQAMVEYEYAFVPMIGDNEGRYVISTVLSKFNGVFFVDENNVFQMNADVSYGETQSVQKIGLYEPIGRKYPVSISNGITSYQTGSVTGTILPENYDPSTPIDRMAIVSQRNLFVNFLNNRRPKIIKDWNGNILMIMSTTNPTTTYLRGSGMGMVSVTAGWTEVGDANDKQDLFNNGLIPTAE